MKILTAAILPILAASAFAAADNQLSNLYKHWDKPIHFQKPTTLVWPAEVGAADICLWWDDKFAACSLTIDDNCKPDHDWWLEQAEKYGFKLTWFVITQGVEDKKNPGFAGVWEDWQRLANAGHSIQSHTTTHRSNPKNPGPDAKLISEEELRAMYKDGLAQINANITNNLATCIAYPSGDAHPEIAKDYALACRGVYGAPNSPESVGYLCTNSGGYGEAYIQAILFGGASTVSDPKWLRADRFLRGWNSPLQHLVHWGGTKEKIEQSVASMAQKLADMGKYTDVVWFGTFDGIAKYGQERDTAKMTVTPTANGGYEIFITDLMRDDWFDQPLTVKIRVPDNWGNTVTAKQAATPARARLVVNDAGLKYAIVDVVPDRGPVVVSK